ncbi:MAG: methyltransferase domain-containing protein [Rickettsia endosymbiont of Ixodes persulcatus]|nr:methyltransferase domain-containing protein [Rickettsia endosymbiont of Ixodes persulcatus]
MWKARDRWNAMQYDHNSEYQYSSARRYLEKLPIKPDQKILDIGCGTGRITAELAKRVYAGEVTGVDLSANMIACAKKKYTALKNLFFLKMDAGLLQIGDQGLKPASYDWVISFWTISWISDHEKLISGIVECLKEGGAIFLLVPLNNKWLESTYLNLREQDPWKTYFSCYQAPENRFYPGLYEKLLEKYNFSKAIYERETIEKEFFDKQSLISFIGSWLPYLDPIPTVIKNNFLKEFVDRYLEIISKNKYIIGFEVFTINANLTSKPTHNYVEKTFLL